MNQTDKELLLRELCSRLPYSLKCKVHLDTKGYCLYEEDKYKDDELDCVDLEKNSCRFKEAIGYDFGNFAVEEVKPYLRKMSSMSYEELNELEKLSGGIPTIFNMFFSEDEYSYSTLSDIIMFMNKRHLDYNHLISKGLAIEAPDGMYEIK